MKDVNRILQLISSVDKELSRWQNRTDLTGLLARLTKIHIENLETRKNIWIADLKSLGVKFP